MPVTWRRMLIVAAVIIVLTAVAIWLNLGPVAHSATASHAHGLRQSLPFVESDWGSPHAGLRLSISAVTTASERDELPAFHVAIENVGASDVVINLGTMIANGKVMFPEAVRLLLTDSRGTTRELRYVDRRYSGIAGRVDDFIVCLRAGTVHAIRVSLDNYWSAETNGPVRLPSGSYRLAALFDGQGARSLNGDTPGIGLFNFWTGTVRSNTHVFDIP